MRNLIMWNLVSLDGFFDGPERWKLDWHDEVWGEELERYSLEQLRSAEALVFGRVTYQGMAAYWSKARGEVADFMNNLPKVVFSRTLASAGWANTTLAGEEPAAAVPRLKREGSGNMFVFGSGDLSETLTREGLFDEYRLCLVPVILGEGRPLFGRGLGRRRLELVEAKRLASGAVILRYVPR